jgi:hypothetical protein
MTAHSSHPWKFGHFVTEEVIEEVVDGLRGNWEFNQGEDKGDGFTPGAYHPMSCVDEVVYNAGVLLDRYLDTKKVPGSDFNDWFAKAPVGVMPLARRAIEKLGFAII